MVVELPIATSTQNAVLTFNPTKSLFLPIFRHATGLTVEPIVAEFVIFRTQIIDAQSPEKIFCFLRFEFEPRIYSRSGDLLLMDNLE